MSGLWHGRCHELLEVGGKWPPTNDHEQGVHMRKLFALLVLVGFVTTVVGCEAKVNEDGAKLKVDK